MGVMTKGALTKALAEKCEVKNGVVSTLLSTLASIATAEAKKNGKFVIPGVVMIKTRQKKATKAGKREMFGQVVMVKAKQSRTSSESLPVCGEAREEAPRVLLQFLLLLLDHSLPRNLRVFLYRLAGGYVVT